MAAPTIAVLASIDQAYAAPLGVTICSALDHLEPDWQLAVYVIAQGLSASARAKLVKCGGDRTQWHWLDAPDSGAITRRYGFGYSAASATSWSRVMAGSLCPPEVDRILYLDADLLVCGNLAELWQHQQGDHIVLAVRDCVRHAATGGGPYFNAGVMLIDLDHWRRADVEGRCLRQLDELQHRSRLLDQDILNTVLAGQWGELPPTWNKQYSLDLYPDWRGSPYTEAAFDRARQDPAIIHFCHNTKPWHVTSDNPPTQVKAFRDCLASTPFADHLPPPPTTRQWLGWKLAASHRRVRNTLALLRHGSRSDVGRRRLLRQLSACVALAPWTLVSVPLQLAVEKLRLRHRL